jgi:hypothetical protein
MSPSSKSPEFLFLDLRLLVGVKDSAVEAEEAACQGQVVGMPTALHSRGQVDSTQGSADGLYNSRFPGEDRRDWRMRDPRR